MMKRVFVLLILTFIFSNIIIAQTTDLIISEYIEGLSYNKSIEIYNGTGSDVDLSNYVIWKVSNGGNWPEFTIILSGTLANEDVYVVSHPSANTAILAVSNITSFIADWNGDDAVGLAKNGTLIDAVGEDGSDPGSGWDVAGVTNATANHTLVRKSDVCSPNTDWDDSRGTNTTDSEWIIYSQDEFGYLGSHVNNCSSGVANPTNFNATAVSTTQIDLSWILNGSGDDVMLAYNTTSTFGTPADGTSYSAGNTIPGGGDVIYNGSATSFNHTGLTPGTRYYYKAWSVDGSTTYSTGVIDDATTFTVVNTDLIISEVADPENPSEDDNAKFVEIFNAGSTTVDFGTDTWYLTKRVDGTGAWRNVQLDPNSSLAPGDTWVVAYNYTDAFYDAYGFYADQESPYINGNGDDPYFLYYNGDNSSGTLVDIYGVSGVDGTGEIWEYKDSKAVRKRSVMSPSSTWTASEWVIIPAYEPEVSPDWHDRDLTWNGGSPDWSDANNWDNSGTSPRKYPPDAGCDLTIPDLTNDPTISGRASCDNMTIESGAVVTVNANNFLVSGSQITNNTGTGGLIVESNASGDGMLLLGSGTTQATVKRYLSDDMSHFISAPITNATADNLYQNHNPEVYLYEYHENDETYNYLVPTSTPMPGGKGFSTWVDDAASDYIIANFDGTLMSSDLTLNGSTTPSLSYTHDTLGWNLVGNPYPVPLDWTKGSWDTTNVEGTIYIWKPAADTDGDPDGTWVWRTSLGAGSYDFDAIPGSQAFFVRTKSAAATLKIPADARTVYYNQEYFKSPQDGDDETMDRYPADYVIIMALNSLDEDEVWISFNEYGTEGFDNGWDASKMFNSYNTISLYVPKETRDQCLEHLPPLLPDEERVVTVNFETAVDGEHSLAIDMTHMPETVDIALEDLKYSQMQNMRYDSVYTFMAFSDDAPDRFRIHFNRTTTGIEFQDMNPVTEPNVHIYAYEKDVYIERKEMNSSGYVLVYDLFGRQVLQQQLEPVNRMKIPVNVNNTYLVVKVISGSKVTTSKVFIR